MNKRVISFVAVISAFCLMFVPALFSGQGNHLGEQKMLDVDIQFLNPSGKTITGADGVFYHFGGYKIHENKVYPPEYWGEFPLYFFGQRVGLNVTVKNKGPRAKAKVRIKTEAYCLLTDGSSGAMLCEPQIISVEIARGETKTIDASFVTRYTPAAESGLDRFLIKVMHVNEGGGPGNEEPGLIMVREGIFCPPEYMEK